MKRKKSLKNVSLDQTLSRKELEEIQGAGLADFSVCFALCYGRCIAIGGVDCGSFCYGECEEYLQGLY